MKQNWFEARPQNCEGRPLASSCRSVLRHETPRFPLIGLSRKFKFGYFDKTEKNEMGGACSSRGGGKKCVQGFDGET
jgi:hypothetical protein